MIQHVHVLWLSYGSQQNPPLIQIIPLSPTHLMTIFGNHLSFKYTLT